MEGAGLTEKRFIIFKIDVFELIEWINNHPLTMAYLYALERKGILGEKND